jgi:hypothetical protein
MKYCASRRDTMDLPTPPFSPPTKWTLVTGVLSSVGICVMSLLSFPFFVIKTQPGTTARRQPDCVPRRSLVEASACIAAGVSLG